MFGFRNVNNPQKPSGSCPTHRNSGLFRAAAIFERGRENLGNLRLIDSMLIDMGLLSVAVDVEA